MENLVSRSPLVNANRDRNSIFISDGALEQPTLEVAERPRKKKGFSSLRTLHSRRPSVRSQVEDPSQPPAEMPLHPTASRVPPSYIHVPTPSDEHPQPPSEPGNESSTTLPESMEHPFEPLSFVSMRPRDSTRSTAGTVSSTRSRPDTPELSDANSSLKTSFEWPQPHTPMPPPPLSTPTLASPVPQNPSPAGDRPMSWGKRANPPGSRSSPKLLGAPLKNSGDVTAQSYNPIPREGRVTFPSTLRMSERMTMSRFSGFDPRSSTYKFIRSAINFSDPDLPDLNFLGGTDNEALLVDAEHGMLGHGGDVEDGHEYVDEQNEEEITAAHNQSGDIRSRSLSALLKTLSEASRGALSVFGTEGPGDDHLSLPKNHHQRSGSTPSDMPDRQEDMNEVEEGMEDLHEETMTDDGLGHDGYQVVTDEGTEIPTDPMAQASPSSSTFQKFPTSPFSSAFPKTKRRLSLDLLSLVSRPPPMSQRVAPPPPIKLPAPPQMFTITVTGSSPLDDVSPSIAFPATVAPLPPIQTKVSILRPKHKPRATRRVFPSNVSTENVAVAMSPNLDRLGASESAVPKFPRAPSTPAPLPLSSPVQQLRSLTTPQSLKLCFPKLGTAVEMSAAEPTPIARKRYIGSSRIDKSLVELRQNLKLPRKKDSGEVNDDEPVVNSPACAFPYVIGASTSAALGGAAAAAPDGFQAIGDTGISKPPTFPSSLSGNETPDGGIQILPPITIPPGPRAASLPPSVGGDKMSDLVDQHLRSPVRDFHSYPSPSPDAIPGGLNSKFMFPLRASGSTAWSLTEGHPAAAMEASSPPDAGESLKLKKVEADKNHGAQGHEVLLQPPLQDPRMADLSSSPRHLASSLVGVMKGSQDTAPASTDLNEMEAILRSALEDVTHLSVSPSRLRILPNTEIGWGKYGEVVQAILDGSSQMPVHVAVKELRNVGTRDGRGRIALRLARELKIWAKVNHPNILPLIGYYLSENYEIAQFISPFMTNGNVTEYFESAKVGLVERLDITNILINESLHAVLGDFGLAALMQDSDTSSGLTTSRTAKGSLRYMSPELHLEDDAKPTLASDVWAWGCTAFEIVTGRLPYHEATKDAKILLAIAKEHQPPGSIKTLMGQLLESNSVDATPALYGLPYYLSQCWDFDATRRPQMPSILDMLCPNMNRHTHTSP